MALENIGVASYHMSTGFDDIDLMKINPGLLAFFGRQENGGFYEAIENSLEAKYDIVRSQVEREKLLARSPGGFNTGDNAKVNKAALFTTQSSIFPQVTSKMAVEYAQLFNRLPNEPPKGELTKDSFVFLGSGRYFPIPGRGLKKLIARKFARELKKD